MLGGGNDRLWKKFCECADLLDYADNPRFATNAARVKNFQEIMNMYLSLEIKITQYLLKQEQYYLLDIMII